MPENLPHDIKYSCSLLSSGLKGCFNTKITGLDVSLPCDFFKQEYYTDGHVGANKKWYSYKSSVCFGFHF